MAIPVSLYTISLVPPECLMCACVESGLRPPNSGRTAGQVAYLWGWLTGNVMEDERLRRHLSRLVQKHVVKRVPSTPVRITASKRR